VQLGDVFPPGLLYGDHYGYRTGLNLSMVEHVADLVRQDVPRWVGELQPGDAVLDIGSNDGTLLAYYPSWVRRVGIDPSLAHLQAFYQPGIEAHAGFFGDVPLDGPFRAITSIAMFYDLEDPVTLARQVKALLAADGVWILEQGYWPGLAKQGVYDVVCHEHLEYYRLADMERIMGEAGLVIKDVTFNTVNGGSFRVVVGHEGPAFDGRAILEAERAVDLEVFAKRVAAHGPALHGILEGYRTAGRTVYGYGASTKGNTVLQHAKIGPEVVSCMVEVSEAKRGCWTPGTHIPIVLHVEQSPDVYLVMPWHFRPSILRREKAYLQAGGTFLFPLPEIEGVGWSS